MSRRGCRRGELRKGIGRLGLLQIDSVNILVRAHYLPLYSRLGAYEPALLDAVTAAKPRRYFEYWGHEASLLPIDCQPLLRWRMARALRGKGVWRGLEPFARERRGEADAMLARIAAEGPLAASDVADTRATKGMWVWSAAKLALEWLFWAGLVAATHRRGSFERVYDLPERVVAARDSQPPHAERRRRPAGAAGALGAGARRGDGGRFARLLSHPRCGCAGADRAPGRRGNAHPRAGARLAGAGLSAQGANAGRKLEGAALLSPFDPLVWRRPRAERLFGFRYRLEIYTPAHRREHGYYVLPFLMDGALVARVDLKADRKAATLMIQRAHVEPARRPPRGSG